MSWYGTFALGFTLSDGQSSKAGISNFIKSHNFDPNKKITRVESIIDKEEFSIIQINFYHKEERLVWLGAVDGFVEQSGGRRNVFDIDHDEQFIGCKLDQCENYFRGVTWIKMKVRF